MPLKNRSLLAKPPLAVYASKGKRNLSFWPQSMTKNQQTQGKIALVSAADKNYFPLLEELIASVNAHEISARFDYHVIDGGLETAQKERLTRAGVQVHSADWPFPLNADKMRGREYLKGCVLRPYIPDIIPDYDMYLWLDSDTWVQNPKALALLIEGAEKDRMCCSILVDRAFPKSARVKWVGGLPLKPRSFYYSNAKKAFGKKMAKDLFGFNVVSAGAFALKGDAPHWAHWQNLIEKALVKGNIFTAEQLTLGIMAHLDGLPMEYLPSWCHWPLNFDILWDETRERFVEPYLPHEEIGILHLSGLDDMRLDKSITTEIKTLSGKTIDMSLRYHIKKYA